MILDPYSNLCQCQNYYVSGYFCFDHLFCVLGRIRKAPWCIAWKKSPKIDIYTFVCSFILSLIHSKKNFHIRKYHVYNTVQRSWTLFLRFAPLLVHSTQRALRRDGSPWTTEDSCTSKILWWAGASLSWPLFHLPVVNVFADRTCLRLPGCVRPRRGVHRQQGEQLHRPVGAAAVHAGLPLEPRHHHRHTGQEVPVCLRDGGGAEGLDSRLPEGHQPTNEATGICRCEKMSKLLTNGISGNFFVVLFFLRFTLFLVLIMRFIFNKQRY